MWFMWPLRVLARILLRAAGVCIAASAVLVLLLRFVPPPTSALMIERRVEALSNAGSKDTYRPQYRWVSLDQIAPVMGAAVISAEDQKFAGHFGFDWNAISSA